MNKILTSTWGMTVIGVVLLVGLVYFHIKDEEHWEQFAAEHHCTVVAQNSAQVVPVFGGKNFHAAVTPSTTTYKCDDGVAYTR